MYGKNSTLSPQMKKNNQIADSNWTRLESKDTKDTPPTTTGNKRSRITRACML